MYYKKGLECSYLSAQKTDSGFVLLIIEITIISCQVFFSFTAEQEKLPLGGQNRKEFWKNEISRCWLMPKETAA